MLNRIYPLIPVTDEESAFLDMYCEGQSSLWNAFFGYRKTDNAGWNYYRVPRRVYELAHGLAELYCGLEVIGE